MNHSKIYLIALFIFLTVASFQAQNVIVQGKLAIEKMDTSNTENLIVVKEADGTLSGREAASFLTLASDTSRTFLNDLHFGKLLCECKSIPPFLVESALEAGYTAFELYQAGVSLHSLYKGGVSVVNLLDFGATIQELLSEGISPMKIYNVGVSLDNIYGKFYQGGYIFFLDHANNYFFEGLIVTTADVSNSIQWGCKNVLIPGANGTGLGTGHQNSLDIVSVCSIDGIAAKLCLELEENGYDDWFLPSKDELDLIYQNLVATNKIAANSSYWTSSQKDGALAWMQTLANGSSAFIGKDFNFSVKAIRSF